MGESQGGLVTALTAPQVQKDIDGIVLLYPAFNIPQTMRDTYKTRADIPERPVFHGTEAGRIYAEDVYDLDPYAEAAKYEGRVLIYHGDNDGLVDISYSQRAEREYKTPNRSQFRTQNTAFPMLLPRIYAKIFYNGLLR